MAQTCHAYIYLIGTDLRPYMRTLYVPTERLTNMMYQPRHGNLQGNKCTALNCERIQRSLKQRCPLHRTVVDHAW